MTRIIMAMVIAAIPMIAADELAGEYAARVPEVASGLRLHANKSFEYFFTYGAADYTAKGTWRRDGDSVLLTSGPSEAKPFRVVRSEPGKAGTARVFVLAPNGRGVQHMDIRLVTSEGPLTERTAEDGMATFEGKFTPKSVFVHVPVYDIEAGPFEIVPGNYDVWLEINGEAITTLQFRAERLRLANGALEMTFWKGDKPIRYKKR